MGPKNCLGTLACDQFSSSIISCQCIFTSFYHHLKLYTTNDVTMHWRNRYSASTDRSSLNNKKKNLEKIWYFKHFLNDLFSNHDQQRRLNRTIPIAINYLHKNTNWYFFFTLLLWLALLWLILVLSDCFKRNWRNDHWAIAVGLIKKIVLSNWLFF